MGHRYAIAAALWILWVLPFLPKIFAPRQEAVVKDPTARWGIILESLAYSVVWAAPARAIAQWRIGVAIGFGAIGIALVGLAIRHLDKQWRVDAGLNADHQLIRTGPYAVVRHPIYASMLAMLLASASLLSMWPLAVIGLVMFILGTEIRVRSEDRLLRSRFGAVFDAYSSKVRAYIPFVR